MRDIFHSMRDSVIFSDNRATYVTLGSPVGDDDEERVPSIYRPGKYRSRGHGRGRGRGRTVVH